MRSTAAPLLIGVLLASLVGVAHATKYPPGPGSTCLDTLTIQDVQNNTLGCRPSPAGVPGAISDSVYSVKGIITAIKNNGTSRTFYMQSRRTDLSYTGMDVFTGNGLPNPNIVVGDSVAVSGKVEEGFVKGSVVESGETEISGFDTSNSTIDVICNILSSGNSLPAFHVTSIAEIRFPANGNDNVPQASAATGEPWESCLVKLIGPLVVGKRAFSGGGAEATYPGIETRSPNGGGMLVYRQGSPGDSIYIDMTSFVTMTPPAVGTVIDSVFGVLQQGGRAGSVGINSWRIAVRSCSPTANNCTDDLFLATPPDVADAFPIEDDSLRIVFDRDVLESSVTCEGLACGAKYSLVVSERAIDHAHLVGDNAVVCHIGGVGADGDLDSVTAVGMTGKVNGLTQTSPKGRAFVNGVLAIPTIQAPNPDSLLSCVDRSRFAGPGITDGPKLSFRGVATGKYFGREYYLQDVAGGPRSGIKVFQPSAPLTVGRQYLIAGRTTEFFGETEINAVTFVKDEGVAATPPVFTTDLTTMANWTCDATQSVVNGEDYEGCLVDFEHNLLTLASAGPAGPGGFFHVTKPTNPGVDSIEVDCTSATGYDPNPNEYITARGALSYRFGLGTLFPRDNGDISFVGPGPTGVGTDLPGRVSFSLWPNPAQVSRISFVLPRRDDVDLAVFDLLGRRLATIARGSFAPGEYARSWDGRTDQGSTAGAGIYFYRLRVGKEVYNLRGIRLK